MTNSHFIPYHQGAKFYKQTSPQHRPSHFQVNSNYQSARLEIGKFSKFVIHALMKGASKVVSKVETGFKPRPVERDFSTLTTKPRVSSNTSVKCCGKKIIFSNLETILNTYVELKGG